MAKAKRQALAAVRRSKLLSIRELADRAGCSKDTVLMIEHGERVPHPGTMRRLSTALGVEPSQVEEFAAAMGLTDA